MLLSSYSAVFILVYLTIHQPVFHEVVYGILVFVLWMLDIDLTIKQWSRVNLALLLGGTSM